MSDVQSTPKMRPWMEVLWCWLGFHFGYVLQTFDQGEYGKVTLITCARCRKVWTRWPYFERGGRG